MAKQFKETKEGSQALSGRLEWRNRAMDLDEFYLPISWTSNSVLRLATCLVRIAFYCILNLS
jgi:hypothetical protein